MGKAASQQLAMRVFPLACHAILRPYYLNECSLDLPQHMQFVVLHHLKSYNN